MLLTYLTMVMHAFEKEDATRAFMDQVLTLALTVALSVALSVALIQA